MAKIELRAKTRQEVAEEFGFCTKTLSKWLKDENIIIPKGLISPKNLKTIYKTFGSPELPKNS